MYKYLMVGLFTCACILGLAVIIYQAPPSAEEQAAEAKTQLKITASNFEFDKPEYKVKSGETLTVILVNKGTHGMAIDDLNINLFGDNLSEEVTFDKPGTYEIRCSISCGVGHNEMKSVLIVE